MKGDAIDTSRKIRESGMRAALALRPKTLIDTDLISILEDKAFDMVLVMTVEPGFGGQKFMIDMMPKVRQLRNAFPNLDI